MGSWAVRRFLAVGPPAQPRSVAPTHDVRCNGADDLTERGQKPVLVGASIKGLGGRYCARPEDGSVQVLGTTRRAAGRRQHHRAAAPVLVHRLPAAVEIRAASERLHHARGSGTTRSQC
jgi:hypothetical protein